MEAARIAAERLRAGDVPQGLGLSQAEAMRLGELCHTWRNYLTVGALAPDLFYLLPDFKAPVGGPLFGVAEWVLNVWRTVEDALRPWDTYMGAVSANSAQLSSQLTGGLSEQLAQAMDAAAGIITNAMLTFGTRLTDVFGQLTSGPPQGFPESRYFWSDMLHYRRTYDLPRVMYERARKAEQAATTDTERLDAQAQQAFALGWMSHCATDVTGHGFTNAKSGGPFHLHWQRHKVVENHFDSDVYRTRFSSGTHYRTLGTSALHFRMAWRVRTDAPYAGRSDAPAYDFFAGFPPYPLGGDPASEQTRSQHYSMAPATLPQHLVQLMSDAFTEVYENTAPDITPKVLETSAPGYSDNGRPTAAAMQVMWQVAFRYAEMVYRGGFSFENPPPPSVINAHPFPTPPGGTAPGGNGRGADIPVVGDLTVVDILLAIVAWVLYIGQIVEWLSTILPGLITDVATFPAREVLHYAVIAPLHSLKRASRRLLVMSGFLMPEPEEVDDALVTLGMPTTYWRGSLKADLDDPSGFAPLPAPNSEPSGRRLSTDEWSADPAYPRDSSRDPFPLLDQIADNIGSKPIAWPAGMSQGYSEWVYPWRYPETDVQGNRLGWEAPLVHAGPFVQGQKAPVLLDRTATDIAAAGAYEGARNPSATEGVSATFLPQDKHLGYPVDYTLYLIAKLTSGAQLPGFNLDSDRGYGWLCWDWTRHIAGPKWNTRYENVSLFDSTQPCSPPAQFSPSALTGLTAGAPVPAEHLFDPRQQRLVRYIDKDPVDPCGEVVQADIDPADFARAAGLPPEGEG
jgi:hypothetical protein